MAFQLGIEVGVLKWSPAQYKYKQWAGLYQAKKPILVRKTEAMGILAILVALVLRLKLPSWSLKRHSPVSSCFS